MGSWELKAPNEDNSENSNTYLFGNVVSECNFVLNDDGSTNLYIKFDESVYEFTNVVLLGDSNFELSEPDKEVKYAISFNQEYWT